MTHDNVNNVEETELCEWFQHIALTETQPSPREWRAKSWVVPQLLRRAVWLCWPRPSLQPPDFFGGAHGVVVSTLFTRRWVPWESDWTWIREVKFTSMVSEGSSVSVFESTKTNIGILQRFQKNLHDSFTENFHILSPNSHPLFSINVSFSFGLSRLTGSWSKRKSIPFLKRKKKRQMAGLSAY